MKTSVLGIIEAIIFASKGVTLKKLKRILKIPEDEILGALKELEKRYSSKEHGIELREVDGRYRFYTKKDFGEFVEKAIGKSFSKLTQAQLEVVIIIIMNGPLTRAEIERRRGKDSSGIIRSLIQAGVLRKKRRGRQILYDFTRAFKESAMYEEILGMIGSDGNV